MSLCNIHTGMVWLKWCVCHLSPRVCHKWWNGGVFALNWLSMLRGPSTVHTYKRIVLFSMEAAVFSLSPSIKAKVPRHLQSHEMRPKLYAPAIDSYAKPSVLARGPPYIIHSLCMYVCMPTFQNTHKFHFRNKTFYAYNWTNRSFYRRLWIPHPFCSWNKCWGATINIY